MNQLKQTYNTPGLHPILMDDTASHTGQNEFQIIVDTTLGPITLQLPKISTLGTAPQIIEMSIYDQSGTSAANPITITADPLDKINNLASIILNTNKGQLQLEIVDGNAWGAELVQSAPSGAGITSSTGLVAAGLTQGTATPIPSDYNRFGTVTPIANGGLLKPAVVNAKQIILNDSAPPVNMNIYPQVGQAFEGLPANAPVTLVGGAQMEVFCFVAGAWVIL